MCTYIKKFSARRYIALTASVKIRIGSPKTARNVQVIVRTKSHIGSKFSKIFFQQLYTGWSCAHCGFCLWRQMAPQQNVKFGIAFFGQFLISLRMDSVVNASIWMLFSTSVTGPD